MVNYPKKSTKTAFEGVGTGNFVRGLSACKNKQENFKKVVLNLQSHKHNGLPVGLPLMHDSAQIS